jgi:hypothetical protein
MTVVVAASGLGEHGEKYVRGSYLQNTILQQSRPIPSAPLMLDTEELFEKAMAATPLGIKPSIAYWNRVSGWGWSTGAMKEMAKQCRQAGVSFAAGQVNELIIEDGDVKGARTKEGKLYRAARLVVLAAGSWSPAVFPELGDKLTATGQVLATIQLTADEAFKYSKTVSSCLLLFPMSLTNATRSPSTSICSLASTSFRQTMTTSLSSLSTCEDG